VRRADGTLATLPRIVLFAVAAIVGVLSTTDTFAFLFFISYMVVGALLAIRRPGNIVSWLLIAIAVGLASAASQPNVDVDALARGNGSLIDTLITWVGSWSANATFVGFAALTAVFPAGGLPEGRWRRPMSILLAAGLGVVVLSMVAPTMSAARPGGVQTIDVPNPIAVLPDAPIWPVAPVLGFGIVIVVFAASVLSMLVRYRRATGVVKLQLRWLLAAIAFVLVGIVGGLGAILVLGEGIGGLAWIPVILAYPTVPIAIGVAILRYRLYDIDRIVNRALVYGALTAILAGVFAASTVLSQRFFIVVTGQSSDAAVVLTTLVVVALYAPIRKRLEGAVDRYFKYDRRLYGPYRDELQRLLDLVDPVRAAARLAREATAETKATAVAVTNADGIVIASVGTWPAEPIVTIPIHPDRSMLGSVLLGPRSDRRPYDPTQLAALAEICALATEALGSRTALIGGRQGNASDAQRLAAAEAPGLTPTGEKAILQPLRTRPGSDRSPTA
jgi:hypothetical protein